MASKTTVQTKQGPLKVTRRLNAKGNVTGRVNKVTFEAKTWEEVEQQIKAAYQEAVEFKHYMKVSSDPYRYEHDREDEASLGVKIDRFEASDHVDGKGFLTRGYFHGPERWSGDCETLREALGIDNPEEGETLVLWTKGRQDAMEAILRELGTMGRELSAFAGLDPIRLAVELDRGITLTEALAIGRQIMIDRAKPKTRRRRRKG